MSKSISRTTSLKPISFIRQSQESPRFKITVIGNPPICVRDPDKKVERDLSDISCRD